MADEPDGRASDWVRQLLACCERGRGHEDRLMWSLIARAGLRPLELVSIEEPDCHGRQLTIYERGQRAGVIRRTVYELPATLARDLEDFKATGHGRSGGRLFPYSTRHVRDRFHAWCARAGVGRRRLYELRGGLRGGGLRVLEREALSRGEIGSRDPRSAFRDRDNAAAAATASN